MTEKSAKNKIGDRPVLFLRRLLATEDERIQTRFVYVNNTSDASVHGGVFIYMDASVGSIV